MIKILQAAMLLVLITNFSSYAEMLSVNGGTPVAPGAAGVSVDINIDDASNIAGASFIVTYDTTKLTLIGVASTFFDSFSSRDIYPSAVTVGTGSYTQGLLLTPTTNGTMLTAVRPDNGQAGEHTIFTLSFDVALDAVGDYPINIISATIDNEAAGYSTTTVLPMLVGIDTSTTPVSFPSVTAVTMSDFLVVGWTDTDGDGLTDYEERNIGTDPSVADTDGDGLDDGAECTYWAGACEGDSDGDGIKNILDDDSDNDGYLDGVELAEGTDPGDPDSHPVNPDDAIHIEIREVTVTHKWLTVTFDSPFTHPVIVAGPPSYNGNDPGIIRIRNVSGTGFEIRMQEWDYLNDIHTKETVSYMAIEEGVYTLSNGSMLEAGSFNGSSSYGSITMQQSYSIFPVVLTQVRTENETDAVTGRIRNIGNNSFQYKLQEMELTASTHTTEAVDYIAWQPGKGDFAGILYEIGSTAKSVTHNWFDLTFETTFPVLPFFIGGMQTTDGGNTASIRQRNLTPSANQIQVDEETSKDTEVAHTTEVIGYFIISPTLP